MSSTEDNMPTPSPPEPDSDGIGSVEAPRCANCGAVLHGSYCHVCGQPVKGMIRPLSNMLSDVADTIFNIDSRIFRTLIPLYFRPGFLTNEYFAGRRTRYVTPFRLYFFLSVAAFLLMQVGLDSVNLSNTHVNIRTEDSIATAKTPQAVIHQRDAALKALEATRHMPFVSDKSLDKAAAKIRREAAQRLGALKRAGMTVPPAGQPAAPQSTAPPRTKDNQVYFGEHEWDPRAHPVHIGWLPGFFNDRLNRAAIRFHDNLSRIRKDPRPFLIGAFGVLPGVLFVLMPLFALVLKVFYIFKRRLYMEHLIVALNSHSFIFLSLLLLTLTGMIRGWTETAVPWLDYLLGWLILVMGWWLPIYLLLMQKRVYRQGWILTLLKYCTIGIGYTIMVAFGIAAAFLVSLATT